MKTRLRPRGVGWVLRRSFCIALGSVSVAVLSAAVSPCGGIALAAEPQPWTPERTASVALFREARQLQIQGRHTEACDKFQESLELYRSPGTLLNIGKCRTEERDLLAAQRAYRLSIVEAKNHPSEKRRNLWFQAAGSALAKLEVRLSHLRLKLPSGQALPADWQTKLDGKRVPSSSLGTMAHNPGRHRLEVSAPGRRSFHRQFELAEGELLQVEISLQLESALLAATSAPALTAVLSAPLSAPLSAVAGSQLSVDRASEPASSQSSLLPASMAITGAVLTVAGGITGLASALRTSELRSQCKEGCADGGSLKTARNLANWANGLVGSGLLLGAIGGTWWLFSGDSRDAASAPEDQASSFQWGCLNAQSCSVHWQGKF